MTALYCKRHYDSNLKYSDPLYVDKRYELIHAPSCQVDDCNKKNSYSGYCSMHYSRLQRYGRLTTVRYMQGQANHPLYSHWKAMLTRCYSKNSSAYKDYGGRGIKVCDRWLESAWNFYEDMGDKPTPKHSIDRIDVNGDYTPENCRWASNLQQSWNKRHKANKYGYTGVGYDRFRGKYTAALIYNNKSVLKKRFDTIEEAIIARKEAENKYINKTPN